MDDKMEARLRDEAIVAGHGALPDVYEWLIPDAKLTPEGSLAALGDLVQSLPSNARVLDCSSGTGQLAVGLARLGLDVVATDASAGMVRRTQELADEHSVPLQALRVAWDDLPDYLDPSTFDLVICVGNSLCHAQGTSGRLAALAAMSRLLNPRGRLVLTSRGSSCALEALGLTSVIGSSAAEVTTRSLSTPRRSSISGSRSIT